MNQIPDHKKCIKDELASVMAAAVFPMERERN